MFKFLKRLVVPAKVPEAPPAKAKPSVIDRVRGWTQPSPLDRLPLPDVHESDDESAWDEWESSHMELDSRIGPMSVYDTIKVKIPTPSQVSELDPFDAIRTKKPGGRLR